MRFTSLLLILSLLCAANWGRADDVASPLLPDAVKLIAAVDSDLAEIDAKAAKQKRDLYAALIPKLVKAQETATKAGKLEAATAAKAKVDEYKAKVAEIAEAKQGKPVIAPVSSISGVYWYDFDKADKKGRLELRGDTAIESGIKGNIVQDGDRFTLVWSNGTSWTIQRTGSDLVCTSGAGDSKLKKLGK